MKKYTIFALTLLLCTAFLFGCACDNGSVGDTSAPSTMTMPTTAPTTMPTTAPTTRPTTAPDTEPSGQSSEATGGAMDGTDSGMDATGNGETAGDNGIVGEDGTQGSNAPAGRGRRMPSMG